MIQLFILNEADDRLLWTWNSYLICEKFLPFTSSFDEEVLFCFWKSENGYNEANNAKRDDSEIG